MNIDIESIKQGFATLGTALTVLKQAKDLMPDGPKKSEINETLEKAERQIKIAESQTAQGIGFELCRNYFPPEIMLSGDNINWQCPECNNKKITGTGWENF